MNSGVLRFCTDTSPAAWLERSGTPWNRLVTFGPYGYPAYARLRYIPDPTEDGQQEHEAERTDPRSDGDQLDACVRLLADATTTPDECYFALWNGHGGLHPGSVAVLSAADGTEPAPPVSVGPVPFGPEIIDGPQVRVPNREFLLFTGVVADAGHWPVQPDWAAGPYREQLPPAGLVWPADRAWFVASDVDPHWAGIGAERAVVDRLIATGDLDIVPADPTKQQPNYY